MYSFGLRPMIWCSVSPVRDVTEEVTVVPVASVAEAASAGGAQQKELASAAVGVEELAGPRLDEMATMPAAPGRHRRSVMWNKLFL